MSPRSESTSTTLIQASGRNRCGCLVRSLGVLDYGMLSCWGHRLAHHLSHGGRLLTAGNGGSAAQAQHLTSELVGRFIADREPFSAIALHAETSALTAIANDFGYDQVFARQVRAHGRPGDVLLLFSSSGRSANLLAAGAAARAAGLTVWGMTGPTPNPLAGVSDEALVVACEEVGHVQETHLIAVHLLCEAIESALALVGREGPAADVAGEPSDDARDAGVDHGPDGRTGGPLVVVGDVLLDRDLTGVVERICPHAPVPVVDQVKSDAAPGGAGLAALLGRQDGRLVVLVTALSDDVHGAMLTRLLSESGIHVIDLGLAGPTPVKTRVCSHGRVLMMLSEAPARPAPVRRALTGQEADVVLGASAVLVSDYGGRLLHEASVRAVLERATTAIPVVWDVHPAGADPVESVRLVTPNVREAEALADPVPGTSLAADVGRAENLLSKWAAASVAVTRGEAGAVLVRGVDALPLVVPSPAVSDGDSCGAGDRFAVTAAALLADGRLVSEAVVGAVEASARYVASRGSSATLSATAPAAPLAGGDDVLRLVEDVRASGGAVVATAGCFDILHAGHVAMLQGARRLGDCLVVCLNDDDSIRRLKGDDRPIVPAPERASLLMALEAVSGVAVFSENRPDRVLREIRPDIYVKGGDYRIEQLAEAELVASWGGRTFLMPYVPRWSTSGIIDTIVQRG